MDSNAQGEKLGGLLKAPLMLRGSQQSNSSKIAKLNHQIPTGKLHVSDEKTKCDETFDEWRSDFTIVLLISMLSGTMISALSNKEV